MAAAASSLVSLSFTIHGKVQGVFFRKYTQQQAVSLGLVGWCMNTSEGTVVGVAQGPPESVESMKTWLRETGSPKSRIDRAVFSEELIGSLTFETFGVREDDDYDGTTVKNVSGGKKVASRAKV